MVTIERREGLVHSVSPGRVVVRIQQQSACSGCHAKEFCCSTDCADRHITIQTNQTHFSPGDAVIIEGRDSVGRLAVLLSFVIPIILLVGVLSLSIAVWALDEVWAILVAMAALAVYYALLRLLEPKLKQLMKFEIIKAE